MRRLAGRVIAVFVAVGCSPQIDGGTYFCGPERLCPPDLACDEPAFTCEAPSLASAFSCPAESEVLEPDDNLGGAHDAGSTSCGTPLVNSQLGCIVGDDVDLIRFAYQGECVGADPHLDVSLRFPLAFAPLALELLDTDGAVAGSGELCTLPGDLTGTESLCLELRPDSGDYFLRIRAGEEADCDGDCRFNQYYLDIVTPLS